MEVLLRWQEWLVDTGYPLPVLGLVACLLGATLAISARRDRSRFISASGVCLIAAGVLMLTEFLQFRVTGLMLGLWWVVVIAAEAVIEPLLALLAVVLLAAGLLRDRAKRSRLSAIGAPTRSETGRP